MIYEEAKKFEALLGGQQWLWSKRVEMLFDFQLFFTCDKSFRLQDWNWLGHTLVALDLRRIPNLSSPVDQSERKSRIQKLHTEMGCSMLLVGGRVTPPQFQTCLAKYCIAFAGQGFMMVLMVPRAGRSQLVHGIVAQQKHLLWLELTLSQHLQVMSTLHGHWTYWTHRCPFAAARCSASSIIFLTFSMDVQVWRGAKERALRRNQHGELIAGA